MGVRVAKPVMWCPGLNTGHPLTRGLVGYWPFWEGSGERMMDVSGAGHHGAMAAGMDATAWVPTEKGRTLEFDGVSGYVDVPSYPVLTTQFSAFVRFKGYKANTHLVYAVYTTGFSLYLASNKVYGYVKGSRPISTTLVNDGQWHDALVTYDNANIRLYIDGVQEGGDVAKTGALTYSYMRLGGLATPFDGQIANVAMWNRALSSEEVRVMSANPWGLVAPPSNAPWYAASPLPTVWYYLYRGAGGISGVDFSNEVAIAGRGDSNVTFIGLGHNANTRYTYVLRPARKLSDDSILITPDNSCRIEFETDGSTEWLGNRPGSVEGVSAEIISGGQIRLRWRYRTPYGGSAPNDFGIYYQGTPDITPGSPDATESYTADGAYSKDLTLTGGNTYYFAITARTSGGVESHLSNVIGPFIADDAAPDTPGLLTSTTF